MLDRMLQFTHVARPVIGIKQFERILVDIAHGPAEPLVALHDEMLGKHRDVLLALAQRRDRDADHTQPVIQVGPQQVFGQRPLRRDIQVGQHAHIYLNFVHAAYAADAAVLQHTQQLGLQRDVHGIDLIEQQRAAVCLLEQARAALRASVSTLFRPEQQAFQQIIRNGRTVDRKERAVCPRARVVDALREQFLARAGLAVKHDR